MKLIPPSNGVAQLMFEQFILLAGKTPEAVHVASGDRMGRESHFQHCAKAYGDFEYTTLDKDGNQKTDRIESGKYFWDVMDQRKRVVRRIVLEPGAPFDPEVYNRWDVLKREMVQPNLNATFDDIGIFIQHLMFISDDDSVGVAYFLNWLAELYQHPEVKIPTAIMMYSRKTRMGKSMLHKILSRVFGPSMVANCAGHELHKTFMDAIEDKRLVVLNELSRSDKADSYERFKNTVSEPDLQFEGKGRASKRVQNIAHFILTTNNSDALPLMEDDGRILVLRCEAVRRPDSYYQRLGDWMEGPGPALLAGVLAQWQFPADWDPMAPVPQTAAVRRTQKESRNRAEILVEEFIEHGEPPFDKDFGTVRDVIEDMTRLYPGNCKGLNLSLVSVGRALKSLGAVQVKVNWKTKKDKYTTSVPYVWRNQEQWTIEDGTLSASKQLIDWYAENRK